MICFFEGESLSVIFIEIILNAILTNHSKLAMIIQALSIINSESII